jgi:transketolase
MTAEAIVTSTSGIDELATNTIRSLAIDMIRRANSGHPGIPLGIAPAVYVLWSRFLRYDSANLIWPNRDRFVLSEGHAFAARVAVEQASTLERDRYVGDHGRVVVMNTFGASAPLKALESKFGFTPDSVTDTARQCFEATQTARETANPR